MMSGSADETDRRNGTLRDAGIDAISMIALALLSIVLIVGIAWSFGIPFFRSASYETGEFALKDGTHLRASSPVEIATIQRQQEGKIASMTVHQGKAAAWLPNVVLLVPFLTAGAYLAIRIGPQMRTLLATSPKIVVFGVVGGGVLFGLGASGVWIVDQFGFNNPWGPTFDSMKRIPGFPPAFAVLAIVGAPVVEELYFRGRLLDQIGEVLGPRWAGAITSALFAVVHMIPAMLVTYFLYGIVLVYLRRRTQGLIAPMIAHAANNALAVYLLFRNAPASGG